MTANLSTVAYIGATILFILSVGGLSNPRPPAAALRLNSYSGWAAATEFMLGNDRLIAT